jgi:DNA polymerase-3 subunit beta
MPRGKKNGEVAPMMAITCNREELERALAAAARIASAKSYLPLLSHVLLVVEAPEGEYGPGNPGHGRLRITANRLDVALEQTVYAAVESVGSITVPARLLSDYVSALSNPVVKIKQESLRQLHIEAGSDDAKIAGALAEDFPPVPAVSEASVIIQVDPNALADGIAQVEFAASKDNTRPVLEGVLLELDGLDLTLVTADGFRLAKTKVALIASSVNEPIQAIVPASALRDLARVLGRQEEPVNVLIEHSRNLAEFKLDEARLVCTLIAGTYPNYASLIPQEYKTLVRARTADLRDSARLTSAFLGASSGIIRLWFQPGTNGDAGKVLVRSKGDEDVGEHHGEFEAVVEGEATKLGISSRYLAGALQAVGRGSEEIIIDTCSPSSPMRFRVPDNDDFVVVQMPMFVTWD